MGGVARIVKSTPKIFKKVTPPPAPVAPAVVAPTKAEVSQATSTDMSSAEISIANKKKGRSQTILNTSDGLGNSTLNTTKKTLGA